MENKELLEVAHFLIKKSVDLGDTDLYDKACDLIGQVNVIKYKIEEDIDLWDVDLEYIHQNLKDDRIFTKAIEIKTA